MLAETSLQCPPALMIANHSQHVPSTRTTAHQVEIHGLMQNDIYSIYVLNVGFSLNAQIFDICF